MINYNNIRGGLNCVIWTRVSTKYQEDNGGSLRTQREKCEQYAKERGYSVKGYFGGTHESAQTPGKLITEMTSYVKRHKEIGTILISEFDRFSRKAWQAIKMLEDMRHLGIIVIATKFGMDTRTKEGMMMAQNTLAMAQWDNQNRTDKFVGGRADCLKAGAWCEKAPLGYSKEGKSRDTYCYLNKEGKLLRMAFKWKLNRESNAEILRKLAANGLAISKQTLHKILVNPFYAGKIVHKLINFEMVDGKIEPAITYNDFLKVQDILSGKTGKYTHVVENSSCPLTKYVICYKDKTPFTSYCVKAKHLDYYKCNKIGCKTNVSAKEMHDKYEMLLKRFELNEDTISNFMSEIRSIMAQYTEEAKSQSTELKKQITSIDKDITNIKIRYATGKIDEETCNIAMQEFNSRKDLLLIELEKWQTNLSNQQRQIPQVIATASHISDLWHNGNIETKKKIQNLVFPNGIYWDKEIRNYRTENKNEIFNIIERLSSTYKRRTEPEISNSVPLCG